MAGSSSVKTQTKSANIAQLCYKDSEGRWIPVDSLHPLPVDTELDLPALRMEEDAGDEDILYIGEAEAGSLDSQSVWRIKKIDDTSGTGISIKWADGNHNYDNIWDSRESLTYI